MASLLQQSGQSIVIRVVLIHPAHRGLLGLEHASSVFLPRIAISPKGRHAMEIAEQLYAHWEIHCVVLEILHPEDNSAKCAVVELLTTTWRFEEDGFTIAQVSTIATTELTTSERDTVAAITTGNAETRGPFARLGWVADAQQWIRESSPARTIDFNPEEFHSSASGHNALARFGTFSGPALWLKATGSINQHEFDVHQRITEYAPECVPPLIAFRPDWRAWVTEEAGRPLEEFVELHRLERAALSLFQLQQSTIGHIQALLACGCSDQRLSSLRHQVPSMIRYLESAMAQQTSTHVAPLRSEELHTLGSLLDKACEVLDMMKIPDTLGHNDLNLTNILFNGRDVVFVDWAEAAVGNPFLSYQHLRIHAIDLGPGTSWTQPLDRIYKRRWMSVISDTQISKSLALSPLLAIAAYVCGRDPHFKSAYRDLPSPQSQARGLARQMARLARSNEFQEAICH